MTASFAERHGHGYGYVAGCGVCRSEAAAKQRKHRAARRGLAPVPEYAPIERTLASVPAGQGRDFHVALPPTMLSVFAREAERRGGVSVDWLLADMIDWFCELLEFDELDS